MNKYLNAIINKNEPYLNYISNLINDILLTVDDSYDFEAQFNENINNFFLEKNIKAYFNYDEDKLDIVLDNFCKINQHQVLNSYVTYSLDFENKKNSIDSLEIQLGKHRIYLNKDESIFFSLYICKDSDLINTTNDLHFNHKDDIISFRSGTSLSYKSEFKDLYYFVEKIMKVAPTSPETISDFIFMKKNIPNDFSDLLMLSEDKTFVFNDKDPTLNKFRFDVNNIILNKEYNLKLKPKI